MNVCIQHIAVSKILTGCRFFLHQVGFARYQSDELVCNHMKLNDYILTGMTFA